MQVIAIENENWLSSIKYHRSNNKIFSTADPNYFEEEITIEEEQDGAVVVDNQDRDTKQRTLLLRADTHHMKEQEKGFLEKNFFLLIVGGCLGGIVLVIILVSILLSLRGKLCQKRQVEPEEPEDVPIPVTARDRNLSSREQRVLSLFMKSSK